MVEIVKYIEASKNEWNKFVELSKNGTFLFNRNYMDYHNDRFVDNSLMFYSNNNLVAILPANRKENTLFSHSGLTYGGIVSNEKMKTSLMLELFEKLLVFLKNEKFDKLIYKAIPHIYHQQPAEEDLYALFINKARLIRRDVSSSILLEKFLINTNRINGARKAEKEGVVISQSKEFQSFFEMINVRLNEKYIVNAVHKFSEMEKLHDSFPNNIEFFTASQNDVMVAGAIIFVTKHLAHSQYLSTNQKGRDLRAMDLLLVHLLNDYYKNKKWFDFGISTENEGKYLNQGLIKQKEEFGASSTNYDTYELIVER